MKRTPERRFTQLTPAAGLALALLLAATPVAAQDDASYGYFRTLEGSARLTTLERGEAVEIEANYPLLTGDRVWATRGSRLEAVLPDGTLVRAEGGTDLFFESLALAADGDPGSPNLLRLMEGEIQVVAGERADEGAETRIDTINATIYLQRAGTYRIATDPQGWTEVVVRESGFAEVVSDRGSSVARGGEELVVDGLSDSRIAVRAAGPLDSLERWGDRLTRDAYAYAYDERYVDDNYRYAAAPLYGHGSWLEVEGRYAWRPRVYAGWRPYMVGSWAYSPGGLFWVSSEPWGWFTYHYGSWDYLPHYGWIWYPGYTFAPAWVYWYWGPTYVGWVPAGYYTRFYGPRYGHRFGFGIYGWAGGGWGYYSHWTFCPVRYFGHRGYRAYWRSGAEVERIERGRAVPRGILTTDTRALTPSRWNDPTAAMAVLREEKMARLKTAGRGGDLPDVTDFVARRPELPDETRKAILAETGREKVAIRTPFGSGASDRGGKGAEAPWSADRGRKAAESPWSVDRGRGSAGDRSKVVLPERPGSSVSRPPVGGPERFGDRGVKAAPAPVSPRGLPERPGADRGGAVDRIKIEGWRPDGGPGKLPERTLPPSPRSVAPPPGASDPRSRFKAPEVQRSPVRRVLEGIRSRGGSSSPSKGSERPPATRPSPSGGDSKGSVSPQRPSRPSQARPKGSSGSGSGKSYRSSPSRGSSGKASASGGSRSKGSGSRPKGGARPKG